MARLIFLTGFMGSGKTEVGRALAKRLKWGFADSDGVVEKAARRGVHHIFAEQGEKRFRAMEREAVRALSRKDRCVVALGGGALLDPVSRAVVEKKGVLVALSCAEPELWRRLKHVLKSRPLLDGPGARAKMGALLAKRRRGYADADLIVSTTRRGPVAAARLIAGRLGL